MTRSHISDGRYDELDQIIDTALHAMVAHEPRVELRSSILRVVERDSTRRAGLAFGSATPWRVVLTAAALLLLVGGVYRFATGPVPPPSTRAVASRPGPAAVPSRPSVAPEPPVAVAAAATIPIAPHVLHPSPQVEEYDERLFAYEPDTVIPVVAGGLLKLDPLESPPPMEFGPITMVAVTADPLRTEPIELKPLTIPTL